MFADDDIAPDRVAPDGSGTAVTDSSESALSVRRLRRTKRCKVFICFLCFICIPGGSLQHDRGLIQVAIDGDDELAIH